MNPKCTHCGNKEGNIFRKSWDMKRKDNRGKDVVVSISLYECGKCGKTFREGKREE